jgi:hypothetical protein
MFSKFGSKSIMFQQALQFKDIIIFYYNKKNTTIISERMPPFLTWHISKIVVNSLSPIVSVCVLNQYNNH